MKKKAPIHESVSSDSKTQGSELSSSITTPGVSSYFPKWWWVWAVATVAFATLIRLGFLQMLGTRAVYITFYPAVTLAALYGGIRGGVLATVLSALAANYFWIEPVNTLNIRDPADWLSIVIFIASGTMISSVLQSLHRARDRARAVELESQYAGDPIGASQAMLKEAQQITAEEFKAIFPVKIVFISALLMMVGLGVLSYRNVGQMLESGRWERHTHEVIHELDQMTSAMKDAETGQRGFLIAGNENYLKPYYAALKLVADSLASVERLTADNARQQARLKEIELLASQKLAELKQTIELRQTKGFEAANQVVLSGIGQRLMDDLRQRVADSQAEERRLLLERDKSLANNTHSVIQSLVVGGILVFALLYDRV